MNAILLVLCLLASPSYASSRPILTYEPAIVNLVGVLELQVFPGPPNYESIQAGDKVERHFYLKLDSPVDVLPLSGHPTVDTPTEERNIRVMQLAMGSDDEALWARFKKLGAGARVQISGTLFHRFNGHHHSRVLLSVERMEPVPH